MTHGAGQPATGRLKGCRTELGESTDPVVHIRAGGWFERNCFLPTFACTSLFYLEMRFHRSFFARLLRRTPDNMAMPCSVKALGSLRVHPQLDVPKWNFKFLSSARVS